MNGTQSQMEERVWSEAETKAFQKKHEIYLDAVADVNDFLEFLRHQHGIDAKDGWQLGDGCFVRPKAQVEMHELSSMTGAAPSTTKQARATKQKVPALELAHSNGDGAQE